MTPSPVYDSYWRFAAERHAMYQRRLAGDLHPWTQDTILRQHRFTNVYRAADRVSQYLIKHVQYKKGRSQAPDEVFFRTILFKLFNRIETWELLEKAAGPISWQSADFDILNTLLDDAYHRGKRIYSAAYIMPPPSLGHSRKHRNHLALLQKMMEDGLPGHVSRTQSLSEVYSLLLSYPGLGPFLAFQYAIDLNYSSMLSFEESDFVVAGPGALDGIAKCFVDLRGRTPQAVIGEMADRQHDEFARLGLEFTGLFGRALQPIDCQNLFCEISKYARVAHPTITGTTGRTRIKQSFTPSANILEAPFFPPRWGINNLIPERIPSIGEQWPLLAMAV
ncbi:MAG: hypothetical protein JWM33_257 [Caulobacteraceae bacterium]|nr:hypothetical protein [Caulobacteraceae bacterium]